VCINHNFLSSYLLLSAFPSPPEGYPEGKEDELEVKAEGLVFNIKQVIAKLILSRDVTW
jgi:hypothetical protein